MMQKCSKLKNIVIFHVKESVYRIGFLFMSKRKAKKLLTNLIDKKGVYLFYENLFIYLFIFFII